MRKYSRGGKSTSRKRDAANKKRRVASGEFHSGNRQPEFPRLHSVARRLNGFMGEGGHDVGGISDDTKAAGGRSEMREILIKRGRTRRHEVAGASSLILQIPSLCPCSSLALRSSGSFESSMRIPYTHISRWEAPLQASRLFTRLLSDSFSDDFYEFYKFQKFFCYN